jgi:hypothetical protein
LDARVSKRSFFGASWKNRKTDFKQQWLFQSIMNKQQGKNINKIQAMAVSTDSM